MNFPLPFPDFFNGIFESIGGAFIALSVIKLHREKVVRGVSWMHVAFFSSWGFWNLYFYPHLDQWFSFWGGLALVATNAVWLGQIVYYNWVNAKPRDAVLTILQPGEYSRDGGETWYPEVFPMVYRETQRYRHADK